MESPKQKNVSLEVRKAVYMKRNKEAYEILLGRDGCKEGRKDLENPLLGMFVDDKEERERRGVGLIH